MFIYLYMTAEGLIRITSLAGVRSIAHHQIFLSRSAGTERVPRCQEDTPKTFFLCVISPSLGKHRRGPATPCTQAPVSSSQRPRRRDFMLLGPAPLEMRLSHYERPRDVSRKYTVRCETAAVVTTTQFGLKFLRVSKCFDRMFVIFRRLANHVRNIQTAAVETYTQCPLKNFINELLRVHFIESLQLFK